MTTLHPVAVHVLNMPGWKVRVWLAVVITLVLTGLPSPFAGLVLWVLAMPYMWMTETLARVLGEVHRARRRLEADHKEHAVLLAERDARIGALEADLARARTASSPTKETPEEALFRQVGLHPRAPKFLIAAARRAFRTALHPDKHLRHARQAHERYIKAEGIFEQIERARA